MMALRFGLLSYAALFVLGHYVEKEFRCTEEEETVWAFDIDYLRERKTKHGCILKTTICEFFEANKTERNLTTLVDRQVAFIRKNFAKEITDYLKLEEIDSWSQDYLNEIDSRGKNYLNEIDSWGKNEESLWIQILDKKLKTHGHTAIDVMEHMD
eukprot:TRINITY_DN333_c0_g1_i10.p1 TRINITY_DN333_c0_g1~~TRINITY_DN333_c0_g1_i10.p1  ORF type:complete len:181 (-),score=71.55 TRINITY_DN333_c0_g1_i10:257-721(-)